MDFGYHLELALSLAVCKQSLRRSIRGLAQPHGSLIDVAWAVFIHQVIISFLTHSSLCKTCLSILDTKYLLPIERRIAFSMLNINVSMASNVPCHLKAYYYSLQGIACSLNRRTEADYHQQRAQHNKQLFDISSSQGSLQFRDLFWYFICPFVRP